MAARQEGRRRVFASGDTVSDQGIPITSNQAADPTGADVAPELLFHRKRHTLVKAHLADSMLSADDYAAMTRTARSHAGGKTRGTKAMNGMDGMGMADGPKLVKDDPAVNFRQADALNPDPDNDGDLDACGTCRFYTWGACRLVEGTVEADDLCDLHRDPPLTMLPYGPDGAQAIPDDGMTVNMAEACADGAGFRLFNELHAYAEPPEWIPYLPKPGTYAHPTYGKIAMTADRAAHFVDNFAKAVYQKSIPIDAEHQTKMSGAVGHIEEMRLNGDGSVDARATWTDRGKRLLEGDRFRYFSPEWADKWIDPVDETAHADIAIGGAITTRPFFKEGSLRPLIATEAGTVYVADVTPNGDVTQIYFEALAPVADRQGTGARMAEDTATEKTVTLSENELRRFQEIETKLAAAEADATEAKQAAETHAAELKSAGERIATMEKNDRIKRFGDLVAGRGDGGDGSPWFDGGKKVEMLERLAVQFGEDSDAIKDYVADQRATAAQLRASKLFGEVGSSGRIGSGDDTRDAQVKALADAKRAANPGLTYEQAAAQVYTEQPALAGYN